ncbi:MAG: hypothetical protein ACRCZF_17095 [Gemmataceae bacterium]
MRKSNHELRTTNPFELPEIDGQNSASGNPKRLRVNGINFVRSTSTSAGMDSFGGGEVTMGESSNAAPALSRLTPDLAAEVRRNLTVWLSVGVAGVAVLSGLFALAVDPSLSGVTGGVAVLMFMLFLVLLLPSAGLLLALVYLFDCWPAMLRGRVLRERYGVGAGELDGPAWRRAMGSGVFWAAAGRGAVVGWAFVSAAVLAWWGLTGKWSFGGPSAILVLLAAQFAARAWFVRQAVARAGVLAHAPQVAEPLSWPTDLNPNENP